MSQPVVDPPAVSEPDLGEMEVPEPVKPLDAELPDPMPKAKAKGKPKKKAKPKKAAKPKAEKPIKVPKVEPKIVLTPAAPAAPAVKPDEPQPKPIPPGEAQSLDQAIVAVMSEVWYIQMRQLGSKGPGYPFLAEADVVSKIHESFLKHKITIRPLSCSVTFNEIYTTAKGTVMNRVMVNIRYKLTHAPSGTYDFVEGLGEGTDVSDKATGKASTSAYKYALRQALLIESGVEPESDPEPDDREREKARDPNAPANTPNPVAAGDKSAEQKWITAREAVRHAPTPEICERFFGAAKKRAFSAEQMAGIEAAHAARMAEFAGSELPAPTQKTLDQKAAAEAQKPAAGPVADDRPAPVEDMPIL